MSMKKSSETIGNGSRDPEESSELNKITMQCSNGIVKIQVHLAQASDIERDGALFTTLFSIALERVKKVHRDQSE
jgi:hypothetical protein